MLTFLKDPLTNKKIISHRRSCDGLFFRQPLIPDGRRKKYTKTTGRLQCILLKDRKLSSSYSNQRGEAVGGWADLRPKTHPACGGVWPTHHRYPDVPKGAAKRKSNWHFTVLMTRSLSPGADLLSVDDRHVCLNFIMKNILEMEQNESFQTGTRALSVGS